MGECETCPKVVLLDCTIDWDGESHVSWILCDFKLHTVEDWSIEDKRVNGFFAHYYDILLQLGPNQRWRDEDLGEHQHRLISEH